MNASPEGKTDETRGEARQRRLSKGFFRIALRTRECPGIVYVCTCMHMHYFRSSGQRAVILIGYKFNALILSLPRH